MLMKIDIFQLNNIILSKINVDISLDCYEIVTNQAANNIFQIWLETCLARCLRASFLLLPSANFF